MRRIRKRVVGLDLQPVRGFDDVERFRHDIRVVAGVLKGLPRAGEVDDRRHRRYHDGHSDVAAARLCQRFSKIRQGLVCPAQSNPSENNSAGTGKKLRSIHILHLKSRLLRNSAAVLERH